MGKSKGKGVKVMGRLSKGAPDSFTGPTPPYAKGQGPKGHTLPKTGGKKGK